MVIGDNGDEIGMGLERREVAAAEVVKCWWRRRKAVANLEAIGEGVFVGIKLRGLSCCIKPACRDFIYLYILQN